MNKENGESGDNAQLVLLATWRTSLGRVFEFYLDRAAPHTIRRWRVTLVLAMIYVLRVYWAKGFHVISYGLATYVLNLFIGFLSPKINPELEGLDGVSFTGKCSDEHRPFQRRLPECRFWYFVTKAIIVSLLLTFISVLDVPVYWHIYLCYWIFLFVVTMKRQIVHMIRYKYNPFTLACQNTIGKSNQNDQQRR